jgi:hypothetical protein
MPQLFVLPRQVALDDDANPYAGALLYFFRTGTETPQAVYSDSALTVPHSQPVTADAGGKFPKIYLDPAAPVDYRIRVTSSSGVLIDQQDDIDRFTVSRSEIVAQMWPQTDEETSAGLTAINTQYKPLEMFRYLTAEQIEDVTSGTGAIDVSGVIQDVIDFASTFLVSSSNPNSPGAIASLKFPPGKYRIHTTLTQSNTDNFCNLIGDDGAEFYHTGTGACLHIGNGTSYGIMPVHVKNIHLRRDDEAAGTIGLLVEHAANGYYEGIGVVGFEYAIFCKGSINCVFDGQRRALAQTKYAFRVESSQGSGGGLRLGNNILTFKNYIINQDTKYGVYMAPGAGVSPSGVAGAVTIENITFETMDGSFPTMTFINMGEIIGYEEVVVRACWFENDGNPLCTITGSRVKFEHCFIANGGRNIFVLNDDTSYLHIEACFAYFTDTQPTSGYIVNLAGTATTAAYANIYIDERSNFPLTLLHATYPNSDYRIRVGKSRDFKVYYNSSYPIGNVNSNDGLAIALFTEAQKFMGPLTGYCDVVFIGTDGTATMGRASLRLYRYTNGYAVKDLDGVGTGYTLTNTTASNATITFADGGTNRWLGMFGIYTPHPF